MGGPPPINVIDGTPTSRIIPEWMDPENQYGELSFLLLKGLNDAPLPKNPFVVGKSVEECAGKITGAALEAGGARYVLKVRNDKQICKLLTLDKLIDGTRVEVQMHPTLNIRKCVVYSPEVLDLTEDEILDGLKDQKVTKVYRIQRKTQDGTIKSPLLVITLNSTVVPSYLNFGLLRVKTRVYYASPMQCFNCYGYGHTAKRCSRDKACRNCSSVHEVEDAVCTAHAFCLHCKSNHSPLDRNCPRRAVEVEIIRTKTDLGLSFMEARKMVEEKRRDQGSSITMAGKLSRRLEEIRSESGGSSCSSNTTTTITNKSTNPNNKSKLANNIQTTTQNSYTSKVSTIHNMTDRNTTKVTNPMDDNSSETKPSRNSTVLTRSSVNSIELDTTTTNTISNAIQQPATGKIQKKQKRKNQHENRSPSSDDTKPVKKVSKKITTNSKETDETCDDIDILSE